MDKIYGMHKVVGLQLFWSGTPTFSSGTPTFCQMGVLNSCFQNPSESSVKQINFDVHSGYGGPFRSVSVHSGPFLLLYAPQKVWKNNDTNRQQNTMSTKFISHPDPGPDLVVTLHPPPPPITWDD